MSSGTSRFNLSAQRLALLNNLLREEGIERAPARTIQPRADRTAPVPLTFSQSRIWFLDQFAAHTSAYVISAAMRVYGDFRLDLFAHACADVVRRHESLRTVFFDRDGRPHQQVRDELPPDVRIEELPGVAPEGIDAELRRREAELVNQPFDLGTGPLLRVRLLRFGPQQTGVLLTMHHIVSDRWSMGVLMRELIDSYRTRVTGLTDRRPALPVQYADFALWQQENAAGNATWQADLDYWMEQLRGAPPDLGLPTDHPRPREKSYRGASVPVEIPPALVTPLRELARAENATLFMVLTAAFKVLLHRLSGNPDIVVGTPVANRTLVELEPLIGLFMNTLALRTDVSGNPSFRQLLRRVSAVCLAAYDHQGVPFERLVEQLQPERSAASTPVFQVLMSYQNVPFPAWNDGPLRVEPLSLDARKAEFDLLLDLFEDGGTIWGRLEYSVDIFDGSTAERYVRMFQQLLRGLVADPDRRIGELPLLGAGERAGVLTAACGTWHQQAETGWAHELFARWARREPTLPALRVGDREVSYGELDALVGGVARRLRAAGVGRGVPVGVVLDRSVELVVALLAVWRAGGTCVPVDPELPAALREVLLAETAPAVLLTQRSLATGLAWDGAVWSVDELLGGLAADDPDNVDGPNGLNGSDGVAGAADGSGTPVGADDPAWVSWTAGTTGAPKGVLYSYRAVGERLRWLREAYPLDTGDRVLHQASLSAEAALWELGWPLTAGATVVLARPGGQRDGRYLVNLLRVARITAVHFRPAGLAEFLGQRGVERCVALRHVLVSGAPLSPELVSDFFDRSSARLHSLYTTTEAAGAAWECRPGDGPVPIGRPIAGAQVYVLDRYRQPVPPGVIGELYIGGAHVAAGYPHRPELTAQRFLPDPFGTGPDGSAGRLFRTGDLGRVRPDGVIELLGRLDLQVSVRGFRVEPARIESVLLDCPGVTEAVVVPSDRDGETRLVAYLAGPQVPAVAELTGYVRDRLPDYLAPAVFVTVPALPRTVFGAVDRAALPEPELAGGPAAAGYRAPRDELEQSIVDYWRTLLGVEEIGVDDNFFDLGGHSLLATKLAAHLTVAHGVRLPLREIFDHPTVEALAARIRQRRAAAVPEPAAIPRVPRDGELPLSFAQEHLCRHHPLGPGDPIHNVVTALRLTGALDEDALRGSLTDIVARHEALRTRIVTGPAGLAQRVDPVGEWPLTVVDLRAESEERRRERLRELIEAQGRQPFRIDAEPMVRGTLAQLAPQETVLVLTMHHLVTDNWSYGVLVRELSEGYTARVTGRAPQLPVLTVQYPDHAAWQRHQLTSGALQSQLDFWRRQLADLPPALTLPRPENDDGLAPATGHTRAFVVGPEHTAGLRAIAHDENATLFMVLLAAFDVLLAAFSGRDDIPVCFPEAGRGPETAELVGWFVNTLVIRADLSGGPTFRELVGRVRDRTLDAYAHRGAPLWAVPGFTAGPDPTRILFNLLNAEIPELELPGLRVSSMEIGDDYVFSEVLGNLKPAEVDLAMIIREYGPGLRGTWLYDTGVFDARALAVLMSRWERLIGWLVAAPDTPVDQLRDRLRQGAA